MRVTKGIILAAGDGNRLGILTERCPKVLMTVGGQPLIGYPLAAQAAAGIEEIAIVVGYLEDQIREVLGDGSQFGVSLSYIHNDDYLGGNAISVHRAWEWVQGAPVVLCMADHLIEKGLVSRLVESRAANDTLCVDHSPGEYIDIDEATKVLLDGDGCIKDIDKGLAHWDALDTGVFLLTDRFFWVLDKLVWRNGVGLEIGDAIRFMIGQGYRFDTCDVSGCFWMDVDTKDDLNTIRSLVDGL